MEPQQDPIATQSPAQPPVDPVVVQETVVVPASLPTDPAIPQSDLSNPFIPSIQVPPASPVGVGGGAGSGFKKLFVIGVVIAVIALLFVLVRSFTSKAALPKEATITYWGLWESDETLRSLIFDFEAKNPLIKVQYIKQSPKQYRERLQSAINRNEGPDVFRFHNTWVAMLKNQFSLVPPTVMTSSEFTSTFFPVIVNDLVAGQSIFGLPIMIDGLGLYINEDLFATAGVTPPTSWTEVINIVPRLTVKNGSTIVTSAIALGTTTNVEHFSDILALMFLQNGASLTTLKGKEAEETLVFYKKFADPNDPLYTWSDGIDMSVSAFAAGRVAMILAPSWRAHDIKEMNPNVRFKIVPVPQLPGNDVAWASYWVEGVSAKSKYQEQAWEFTKYLTSAEGASRLYTEGSKTRMFGEPYARIDLANTIMDDPFTGAYVKQAKIARSFPLASRTYDNGLNDRLIKYLEDAVNGMATSAPSKVLETASAGFRQILSTYGLITAAAPTPN